MFYEYLNKQNIKRKSRVSFFKTFYSSFMHSFFIYTNVGKCHKKKYLLNKKLQKGLLVGFRMISKTDHHLKAWQSLLPLHWLTFHTITLHSFDAILYIMIVSDYQLFFGFFFTCVFLCGNSVQKMCTSSTYHITNENTDSRSTSIAIYI